MAAFDDDTPLTDEEHAQAARGADLLAAALADPQTLAPAALREAIERERAQAAQRTARPFGLTRARVLAALAGLAAVVAALVLALGTGGDDGPGPPSATQVAAVARLSATAPAPATIPATGTQAARLDVDVEGTAFPEWSRYGWTASGRRADRLGGRVVTTVFYRSAKGATLGYAIVAGERVGGVPAGRDVRAHGERYRVAHAGGRTTVAWTQDGHTCIIDAPATVPDERLVELASWSGA